MQSHPASVDGAQEKQLDALLKLTLSEDRAASRALAPAAAEKRACVVGLVKAHSSYMALKGREKCLAVNCKGCESPGSRKEEGKGEKRSQAEK